LHEPDTPEESGGDEEILFPDALERAHVLRLQPLVEEALDEDLEGQGNTECESEALETLLEDGVEVIAGFSEDS